MSINFNAIWEGVKELLRLVVLGAIATLITYLTNRLTGLDPGSAEALVLTVVLRILDKVRHYDGSDSKGLLPF